MYTPQEVSEKTFPKSTGLTSGYNMTAVDEFLDGLTEDYTALYKDNTTLKAKLKMLAEKVEEYRATEDAMRSTLLAAQKMAAQMVADAQAEKEKTIADAQAQAEQILADARGEADIQARQLQQEIRDSWEKLAAAQNETADFIRRSRELCARYGVESCNDSGYQEVTLSSLSTSDYPPLTELCDQLEPFCQQRHVNLSLPSLRADNFSMSLMERLAKGRKSGLTFAPEAGTQRLRDVINKNVTQEDLLASCRTAFAGGYSSVKLYFMLGLPTETDEDVLGIADLAARVMHTWRESASNKNRGVRITVSTSWFVPKPHTAFQWEPQISKEEYERRVALLREAIKTKTVTYNWHDSDTSFLEAVLARGDRRMGKVLETAWRKGAKLDAWEEYFSLDRWLEAFDQCGLDPHFYANRTREKDELMPWAMISSGVTESYLWRERERAFAGVTTPDCRTHCNACGANRLVGGKCDV